MKTLQKLKQARELIVEMYRYFDRMNQGGIRQRAEKFLEETKDLDKDFQSGHKYCSNGKKP